MKVLVATDQTQGTRPSDVMDGIDGELVFMVDACPYSRRFPYGSCDCGITFRGMVSDGVTSTAVVRELEQLTLDEYVACMDATHEGNRRAGCTCDFDAEDQARRLLQIAAPLRVGAVVERRVDRVRVRAFC
jgi:hypothetical protein